MHTNINVSTTCLHVNSSFCIKPTHKKPSTQCTICWSQLFPFFPPRKFYAQDGALPLFILSINFIMLDPRDVAHSRLVAHNPYWVWGGLISAYFAEIPHLLHKGATIPHLLMTTTRLFYACDIEIRYHNLSNHTHNTKTQVEIPIGSISLLDH